jgi:hypothetical protein
MSGPKRNPDKLNTIGIVVVGICGAVLVYVTIVALQAFYMNDTSDVQNAADYGGQEITAQGQKAKELEHITTVGKNEGATTVHITIDSAMKLVEREAAEHPDHLVPALPLSNKPTIEPVFGRPKLLGAAVPPAEGSAAGSGAAPAGSAAGSAAPAAGGNGH